MRSTLTQSRLGLHRDERRVGENSAESQKREEACIWSGCLRGREEGNSDFSPGGNSSPHRIGLTVTQFQTATQQREQLYCSLANTSVGYWFPMKQDKENLKCMTPLELGGSGRSKMVVWGQEVKEEEGEPLSALWH